MNAGTLEIQLAADVARLRSDMGNALGIVQRTARGFDDAAAQMRNALGGIGGGLSAAAFGTWIKSAIDFQDQLNDLNKTTDIAVSKLAGISLMSKQTGSDLTGMAQAMNKLTLEMGKAPEKFAKIGITAKSPLEAFGQLSDIFKSIEDPQLRAAVAAEALGKSWASTAPALSEGSKAIADMVARGEELAGITKLDAEMADAFNDSMSELQLALMGTASNLAGDMLPLLTELVKSLTDVTASANNTETPFNILTETLRALIVIGGNVAFVIHGIAVEIGGMAAQAVAFGSGNFSQAAQIGRDMTADAERRRVAFDAWEQRMMSAGTAASSLGNETDALSRRMAANAKATLSAAEAARLKAFVDAAASKKAADELKKQREEDEKFRIAWGRADATRQGDAVLKRNEEEAKALAAAIDGLTESRNRQFDADAKVIKSAEDMVKQAQFELSIMGLSNVEREKAIALRQLEATGIDKATLKYAELAEAISKTVTDRAAMKKQIDDFQNVWNSIDRTAQQTFTNIFEGGQDAFTKLRDTLKATLLDLLYQMTVRKWVFNLAANVTGASSGVAGVVGQSVLGQAGNALGLGSMFSGGGTLTGYASQALGAVGLGNVGAGLAGVGGSFASSVGAGLATDALGATVAEGAAAATLGAGSTIGAAIPYIGAALVAGQALGLFDSKGGPKTIGGASDAATIQATVAATLAQFGIKPTGLRVGGFSAADPMGDSLTQLQTALFRGDTALYSRQDRLGGFENVGRSSEELAAAWAEETARITLAALQATLEPKYQQYLREVDANTSSADAINAALARVTTARTLEERLLELSSTEAENLARARARELDAMDETLRPLLRQIQAQEDLKKRIDETNAALLGNVTAAYDALRNARGAEVDQLGNTVTRLRDYGRSLREFRDGLLLGNLSTLTPGQRLEEARRQLENTAQLARGGDVNAQGQVQGLVSAFLEASATYNASGAGFTSDFAYTQQLLTELSTSALAGADVAQLQLDALGVLNQSVLTIPAALTNLAGAITTAIGAGLNPGAASIGALAGGVTGERIKTEAGSVYASASGASSLGNTVYTKNGKTFTLQELQNELIKAIMGGATSQDFATASAITGINRADALAALAGTGYESRLPAFRNGGMHSGGWAMVGEAGPELAYMPPSRIYSNSDTRQMLDIKPLVERIKSLEGTVQQLGQALVAATYDATSRAADKTVDGVAGATSRASFAAQTVPVLA